MVGSIPFLKINSTALFTSFKLTFVLFCFFAQNLFSQNNFAPQIEGTSLKCFSTNIAKQIETKTSNLGKIKISEDPINSSTPFIGKISPLDKNKIKFESVTYTHIDLKGLTKNIKPKEFKLANFKTKDHLRYAIEYLDITCGLPSNKISGITKDSSDNIWIAYSGGIAKLTSNTLKIYDASVGFPDFPITSITYYHNTLYVGTFGGGFVELKDKTFTHYSTQTGFCTNLVLDFAIINDDIFLATYGEGLLKISNHKCFTVTSSSLDKKNNRIIGSLHANNKSLFLPLQNGYGKLEGSVLTHFGTACGIPEDNFGAISTGNNGEILLAAENNFLLKITNDSIISYANYKKNNNTINHIFTGKSGKIWLCTNGDGIYGISARGYMKISEAEGLSDNFTNHAFQDRFNNLWITTKNGGINLLSPSNFVNLETQNKTVQALFVDQHGTLIYENGEGGLNLQNDKSITHYTHKDLKNIKGIVNDTIHHTYWISASAGLFSITNNTLYRTDFILENNSISNLQDIIIDKQGFLWLSDYNYGVFKFQNNKAVFFPDWSSNGNSLAFSSMEDNKGNVWVFADRGNFSCFKKEVILNYKLGPKYSNLKIFSGCQGNNGEIYLATNAGAYVFSRNSLHKIYLPIELKNERIQSILFDKKTRKLWIATPNGLVSYTQSGVQYFNEEFGIASASFNFKCVTQDIEGNIYWSNTEGILRYTPFHFNSSDIPRVVTLENISLEELNSPWTFLKEKNKISFDSLYNNVPYGLSVPLDFNNLVFDFSSTNWGKEENTRFYYKLNDAGNWTYFGNDGILKLENLPGNNYSLKIKAELGEGISTQILTYNFTIKKPFYLEPWFLIVISILILSTIWLLTNRFSEFSFDNFSSYGNDALLITKTRILSFTALLLTVAIDFYHSEISHRYTVSWPINSVYIFVFLVGLAYTFRKKVNYSFIDKSLKYTYIALCALYIYRAFINNYEPILSLEVGIILLFSVLIFKDIKNIFLLAVFFVSTSGILLYISESGAENKSLFLFATIQALVNIFLFTYIENKQLSKVLFSDKILNNSEHFILVSNAANEIIYANQYMADSLGFKTTELLNQGWWNIRGWNHQEINKFKLELREKIKNNKSDKYRNTILNKNDNKLIYIEWQETPIEGRYLLSVGKDITTEAIQKEELEKLSIVAKHVNNGVVITDNQSRIEWANDSFLKLMGYALEELIGKRPIEMFSGQQTNDQLKSIILQDSHADEIEILQYSKTNEPRWLLINNTKLFDKDKNHLKNIEIVTDITERKNQEFEKQQYFEKQQHYNEVLTQLSTKPFDEFETIDDYYATICKITAETMSIERVGIWSVKDDSILCESLFLKEQGIVKTNNQLFKSDYPNYFNAIFEGTVIAAPDIRESNYFKEFSNEHLNKNNVKSLLDIPIRSNGGVVGIICCEKTETKRDWNEQDLNFVKSLADLVSINIEANKRKIAESIIKESERNFRLLNETIDDVFWLFDLKLKKVVYISPSCESVLGANATEFYTTNNYWEKYIFDEDKETISKAHKKIETEGFFEVEYRIHAPNGLKWIYEKSFGIKGDDGTYVKSSGICSDITERKRTERTIKQLSLVAQKTENIITISDPEDKIEWVNDAFTKLTGYTLEEVKGTDLSLLLQGELTDKEVAARITNGVKEQKVTQEEIINYKKNGDHYWIGLNVTPVFDNKNQLINFISIGQDITERKLKEQLIQSQHLDIISSINYAKRIQNALLPSKNLLQSLPIEHTIYYKPKDIIGGDFYWADQVGNKVIFAIGDCTGHGVPGALMTSLGINGLINAVTEQKMTDPAQILTYLDNYIYGILSTGELENKVNDGMDIGIVCIDMQTQHIQFSGAGRPLIYIKNDTTLKIDSSRKSIGSKIFNSEYETTTLTDVENASFYMFSDGMTDQFGGEKNKRLGNKVFLEILKQHHTLPLHEQKNKLTEFYHHWDYKQKQTDDMILLAFKLNEK